MIAIPLYDAQGQQTGTVELPVDDLSRGDHGRSGRVGRNPANGTYYKGCGCRYHGHFIYRYPDRLTQQLVPEQCNATPSEVFYLGFHVQDPRLVGKTGIFAVPYQPIFSDPIGGCGPKEVNILRHQGREYASPEVIDTIPVHGSLPITTVYHINYRGGRHPFASAKNGLDTVFMLLEAGENWPWDKSAVRDLNVYGLITDTADLFHSTDPNHQFGTVYAYLYSARALLPDHEYQSLCHELGWGTGLGAIPKIANDILRKAGLQEVGAMIPYPMIIHDILMTGRNCAHLENPALGDQVAAEYRRWFREGIHYRP